MNFDEENIIYLTDFYTIKWIKSFTCGKLLRKLLLVLTIHRIEHSSSISPFVSTL